MKCSFHIRSVLSVRSALLIGSALSVRSVAIAFSLAIALLGCSADKNSTEESTQPNSVITTQAVNTSAVTDSSAVIDSNDVEWASHGLTWDEQRYSPLKQINDKSVKDLGLDWSFDMYTHRGVEATPLMVNRTIYVTSAWSVVYALDAVTGEKKWFYDPHVERAVLAKSCCDAVNRGVAYHDGKIFVGTFDGRLVALDANDGSVLWDVQTTDRDKSYTITGAPRIAKGKVIIGNGGAELGVRGYVSAYDENTGKMVWRFYTVPGNPKDGFENDAMEMAAKTWTGKWWEWGGGGTVWDSMVYDPELDLLYIGVGNGSPWNHSLRSPEGGDNLFLTSIVALNPNTGEYVWHYQTTPGETWDYTATQHMMLADLDIDGKLRKVLMQAPKNGFFYVLDRKTGELISAEKYTTANWATHIDMKTGRPVETPTARVFDGKNVSLPSNAGGHNWPAMSYNPNTGWIYIPTMVFPIRFLAPTNKEDMLPNQGNWNVGFDRIVNVPPDIDNLDEILAKEYQGQLIAWDPVQQKVMWAQEPGAPNGGGTLSTAGNLVFQGSKLHNLSAFNATTGDELWSYDVQTGAMAPPITYEIDGVQYIAIAVGFGGGFATEGGPVAHGWRMPNRSRLLVFKIGGTKTLPPTTAKDFTLTKPLPVTASDDIIEHGKVVYHRQCAYCHGDGFRTGGINPDLRYAPETTHNMWDQIVREGIFSSGGMVSFKKYVSKDDAEAIRQYVLSEANKLYEKQQSKKSEPATSANEPKTSE